VGRWRLENCRLTVQKYIYVGTRSVLVKESQYARSIDSIPTGKGSCAHHRIIESFRLEKTLELIKFNH